MSDLTKYKDAVLSIKNAILQSRYQAAQLANKEQLMLYYGIGRYVSANTRTGKWGKGAIEDISFQLQKELPGLRGFSATNMKNMRLFYENWQDEASANRQSLTDDLTKMEFDVIRRSLTDELADGFALPIHHLASDELTISGKEVFLRIGFTHHIEILTRCKDMNERWYYIQRCAAEFWGVRTLKTHIRNDDFARYGALPNNFALTIPDAKQVAKAVRSFKDEYLLDFINIEDEDDPELIDERVLERGIIANVKEFIEKFGEGFCFIGNQYRVLFDEQEFFCDILFFNRNLNCLVAIELKRGIFKPSYLDHPHKNPPFPFRRLGVGLVIVGFRLGVGLVIVGFRSGVGLVIVGFRPGVGLVIVGFRPGQGKLQAYEQLRPVGLLTCGIRSGLKTNVQG